MIPVPTSRIKAVGTIPGMTDSGDLKNTSFAETFKRIRADELLRSTGQYGKLRILCQNSDAASAREVDAVIRHNELLAPVHRSAKTTEKSANPPFLLSEENLLIMNATYDNNLLNSTLVGHGDEKHLFLPLNDLAKTLDFNIDVDDEKGSAKGWFISEGRNFTLDLAAMRAVVEGKQVTIKPEQVKIADRTIFVDSRVLSQWFPVDFKHDFSTQSLEIVPRETLPFQARIERERGQKRASGSISDKPEFPRRSSEYNLAEAPVMDIGISASYAEGSSESGNKNFKNNYYLLSKGDLGKMTTEIYLSGDDSDLLENSRFSIERNDPDAQMLGPLRATRIAAGDIRTTEFPITGGGENERGISISNQALNRSVEFDTTHFEGNLPPGWDVEVYRNKMLLASQRVDATGRYNFEKLPIYYGKNDFELIFYGPQGQKQVEKKQINIGNQMIKKGEKQYDLSLSQKDSSIYDNQDFDTQDEDTFKLVSRYQYGLADNLSFGGGVSSQKVNGERHDYLSSGFKSNLKGAFVTGDWLHDLEGGDAAEALIQTGVGPVDLKLKQQLFSNFTEDDSGASTDPLKSVRGLSLSGRFDGGKLVPTIPFSINFNQIERDSSSQNLLGAHFATTLQRANLNSYVQWMNEKSGLNESSDSDSSEVEGYLQASGYLGKNRLRGRIDYELEPEKKIKSAEIANHFRINDKLNSEIYLKTDIENSADEGALRFNWNSGKYNLSPEISYSTEGEFKAMMTLSTSLGIEPRSEEPYLSSTNLADTGAVSARVFHDKNGNQIFDDSDEPIKGASVKAVQSYRESKTNDMGVALLTGVPKYRPTDVVVDKETLEDPSWEPSGKGVSIVPRPGHTEIMEFPIVTTGEIDGTVRMERTDGEEEHLSNVPIQLLDNSGKVVQEVRSEYDGFYLFEKIPPGRYSVQVAPESRGKPEKRSAPPLDVVINSDGNIESGKDILLKEQGVRVAQSNRINRVDSALNRVDSVVSKADISQPVEAAERQHAKRYGLHLTSYRSEEKAFEGIRVLRKKLGSLLNGSDFTVQKVDLGQEKGVWFRVIAGDTDFEKAKQMGTVIKREVPYCRVMKIEKGGYREVLPASSRVDSNVEVNHSYKYEQTYKPTEQSHQYNQLTLRKRDEKIEVQHTPGKSDSAISVHLASYKSHAKAALGLEILKKQFEDILGDQEFFIRRVDLGPPKGTVFRLAAGRFSSKREAQSLKESLNKLGQYAQPMQL